MFNSYLNVLILRNSGIVGGKFLQRCQIFRPNSDGNIPYVAADFFVGAILEVYGHKFVLHDADEYALNFMEANPSQFPKSDLESIQNNLQSRLKEANVDIAETFKALDTDGNGYISLDEFRNAIIDLNFDLTEQIHFIMSSGHVRKIHFSPHFL